MFNGYSKDLFEEKNESAFLNNVKAVCAIRDKYNFRKATGHICVLEGLHTTVMIFYGNTSRLIIHLRLDTELDPEYSDEISLKLMRLNDTYGLNLSLDDSHICCDYTVFTKPHPVSTQCFLAIYETFMKKIETVRDELIELSGKYARSFLEQDLEETAIEVQDEVKEELEKHLESAIKKMVQEQDLDGNSDEDSSDFVVCEDEDDDIFSLFDNDDENE